MQECSFLPTQVSSEKLPLEIAAGISQELKNVPIRWHITFENLQNWNLAFANPARTETTLDGEEIPENVNIIKEFFRHTIIGAELFPDRGFNIRLGYNFRRGRRVTDFRTAEFLGPVCRFWRQNK